MTQKRGTAVERGAKNANSFIPVHLIVNIPVSFCAKMPIQWDVRTTSEKPCSLTRQFVQFTLNRCFPLSKVQVYRLRHCVIYGDGLVTTGTHWPRRITATIRARLVSTIAYEFTYMQLCALYLPFRLAVCGGGSATTSPSTPLFQLIVNRSGE